MLVCVEHDYRLNFKIKNSLQADIALLRVHVLNTVKKNKLDYLESLPHVLLIGLFRKVYFDEIIITEIERLQVLDRDLWKKENDTK